MYLYKLYVYIHIYKHTINNYLYEVIHRVKFEISQQNPKEFKWLSSRNFSSISAQNHSPVTGASMSRRFFSERRIAAPSPINRSATLSSTRPSLVRWAFRTSTLGFPSLSNTSFTVSRWLGGNGTAGRTRDRKHIHFITDMLKREGRSAHC